MHMVSGLTRLKITLLIAALAAIGLVAGPFITSPAHAEIAACYTDPVVVLSNGVTLDLSNTISDSYTDVQQVVYTIHAPVGTSIVSVTYTSGPIGPKESLQFSANGSMSQYTFTSTVTTGASNVPVQASVQAVSLDGTTADTDSGWDNQQLKMTVTPY